jgi:hypothetical protein
MADQPSENMVLRTVYLPRELDQQLKTVAFRDERSKNDIIRELIQAGLQSRRAAGDHRFDDQPIKRGKGPAAVRPVERSVEAPAKVGTGDSPKVGLRRARKPSQPTARSGGRSSARARQLAES